MTITGLVTALRAEASCVSPAAYIPFNQVTRIEDHTVLWLSGMGAQAARTAAEGLQQHGAAALVSFGVAGALNSNLKPGDLILPDAIHTGEQLPVDMAWRNRLQNSLPADINVVNSLLAHSAVPLTSEKAKFDLAQATGAWAVDMESGAVAAVAAAAGIPFIAVRAIIDPVQFSPPQALLDAIYPDGRVNPVRLVILLLKRSVHLSTLLHMAAGMRAARRTLSRVIQSVGTGLSSQATNPGH
ncbi:phosphorylase [Nitrosomonas sp. Nm166]|uniref:phosphorylase family protein n=1 Tax=Nitrosomonas sp. Nm166 TaxID=1881054 RepID=UPI0008E8EB28|nr:phosphorylase [Nitrosomonas sp. Nm166]SFE30404.1 hopanoid-associated phosphorylase [Nitrosomonas sp. Nm166]